ncbi:MAG: helix-turn-helix domain-containing protein [Massilia sp.]
MSGVVSYACVSRSYRQDVLIGTAAEGFKYQLANRTFAPGANAHSILRSKAEPTRLLIDFTLDAAASNPYAATAIVFTGADGKPALIDLSRYGSISFDARCYPSNTLSIGISTFDPRVSKPGDLLTYRTPSTFIACEEAGAHVDLDLTRMSVPQWWFDMFKLNLSQQGYALDKVAQIEFGSSSRSPTGVATRVEIAQLTLHGRDYGYIYFLGAVLVLAWGSFAIWFFRQYAAALSHEVQSRLRKDLPLVAYQQLSIEPHRDKEKGAILKLMATRYGDSDLDLETVVAETGVNRNKVNDILKAELGYTFSTYLNKLRLTEASRLLTENANASIAEIAYSVGYKNVSYFNKLFKEEYQCTPKAFREVITKNIQEPAE